jgi:S1-C subfamily serine protease
MTTAKFTRDLPFAGVFVETFKRREFKHPVSVGSGFIFKNDDKNFLVTNWHVVCAEKNFFDSDPKNSNPPEKIIIRVPRVYKPDKITFTSWETKTFPIFENNIAKWVTNQKYHFNYQKPLGDVVAFDIGSLSFAPRCAFSYSGLVPSSSITVGQKLFIVGYPSGLSASTKVPVSFVKTAFAATTPNLGLQDISLGEKKSFRLDDGFFTDGNTTSGMSGSPVIDESGKLVGIYSGRLNPTDAQIGIVWGKGHILAACGASLDI